MSANNDMRLAFNWRVSRVRRCLWKRDRRALVRFIRERHEERFFLPIKRLREAEMNWQGHGFAMMSLCSLLVETIQSYREGLPSTFGGDIAKFKNESHVPKTYQIPATLNVDGIGAFRRFFQDYSAELGGIDGESFYRNVRNGLLHQGQTKAGWKINWGRDDLFANKVIDRDRFASGLEQAFHRYLQDLSASEWNSDIWKSARRKIWWLIHLS